MQRKRRNGNNNWIGFVVFLVVVFGSDLSRFLAGVIHSATGVSIDSTFIFIGLIILAVVGSAFGSLARGLGRINSGSETQLPTMSSLPPTMPGSGAPSPLIGQTGLPGSPRFEPVINPRILAIGVIGLLVFGGVFVAILAIFGVI